MTDLSDSPSASNQTFTSRRLDAMKGAAWDRRLKPVDKLVCFVLWTFVNEKTGNCYPSIELIAERSALSPRHVSRSLVRLERLQWWKIRRRRQGTSIYTPLFGNVNAMFDEMTLANDARKERRHDSLVMSEGDKDVMSGVTRESYKHPRGNTSEKRVDGEERGAHRELRLMRVVGGGR